MKITVKKGDLLEGLQLVQGIVGARTTLPILANVLLKTSAGKLWLTATDLEVSMRCSVAAEVKAEGATTLPARKFLTIVRELPEDVVGLEVSEKNAVEIDCGESHFKILGLPEDEFPALPEFSGANSYTIDRGVLKDMLQKTAYAASIDEMRHILNGNLLSFKDEKLLMVATDGRRLALAEHELEFPKDAECEVVVPTKVINELLRGLQGEGPLRIHVAKNQIAFEADDTLIISKLIEGQFPNFRQVIPAQCEQRVTVERESLLNAVRRMALLTSEKANSVRMTFGKNKVLITASSPDVGEAHESVPIKYTAKEIAVAFNPEFLMDPLRVLTNDEIFFEITDELSPGVIKCEGAFLYVIMPMRLT